MKKILAIFLALIMIMSVALVACSKDKGTTGGSSVEDDDDNEFVAQKGTETSDTDDEDKKKEDGEWTALSNATIYTMCSVYLRNEASKNSTNKIEVAGKTMLTATAKSDDGDWYKVSYEGQDYYIDSDYVALSLDEATFTDIAEGDRFNVTVKAHGANENPYTVYLGKLPTFDRELTGTITVKKADTDANPLIVLAKNGNGKWYKVSYKGDIYYLAVTSKTTPYLDGVPSNDGSGDIVGG